MISDPHAPLIVGIDAGGTKSALLASHGDTTISLSGPGAHVLRDGAEAAARGLAALIGQASDEAGGARVDRVCVGVAGAGREPEREALERALNTALGPNIQLSAVHDAQIALDAAWDDGSGALLVVGTGSILYARTQEGEMLRAGGWGWRLGDDGSGTALGQAALRAALAAHDGGPPTSLTDIFAEEHELPDSESLIHAIYADEEPLASFAPTLLNAAAAGDWVAEQLLVRQTNALGQQAGWLATRVGDTVLPRIALVGGLLKSETYRPAILGALERHLPGWDIEPDAPAPVTGALRLAQRLVAA